MALTSKSICTIILAYGARTEQLNRVLVGLFTQEEVSHVLVVANAVTDKTLQMLAGLKDNCDGRLEIVKSEENIGSAGGYELGLRTALKKPYDYFWLLDDDNLPQQGALTELLATFSSCLQTITQDKLVLQSFRLSLPEITQIVRQGCQSSLPRPASFIGFHMNNLWETFCSIWSRKGSKVCTALNNEKAYIRVNWAPYGGLFFHRDAIRTLGFPNPLFFLYADDLAYTLNFTSKGGNILLVPSSRVIDLEPVWNATGGEDSSNVYRRLNILSPTRTYYEVRNRVYLGRTMFPGHSLTYFLNKWVYLLLLGLLAIYYRRGDRFKLILRAAHDGECGQLGKQIFENEK
ncbi:glycosyltransferase [bacterium]|nr:glycosyltransferase [bacterium]